MAGFSHSVMETPKHLAPQIAAHSFSRVRHTDTEGKAHVESAIHVKTIKLLETLDTNEDLKIRALFLARYPRPILCASKSYFQT